MKRYRITGLGNRVDKFFEVCRSIPLVLNSWPYEGENGYIENCGKGFYIQLSPRMEHSEFLLHAICTACDVKCESIESAYEHDLKACKDMLRFFLVAVENGHLSCTGMDVERLRRLSK